MTTGSYNYVGTTYRRFKQWSGADDPLKHTTENPYTSVIIQEDYNEWTAYTDGFCHPWTAFGRFQPTPEYRFPNRLPDAKAIERLIDKVRGHSFDLGNYIPEGRQTVDGARNVLGRMARGLIAIRKRDPSLLAEAIGNPKVRDLGPLRRRLSSKSVAQQHLELQYGIVPLLSDVFESAKAFEAIANQPRRTTVRVSATTKDSWEYPSSLTGYTHAITGRHSVRLKAEFVELNPLRSLGLLDPAGMIWEGTPFSFVVDWFIPIGSYLDALNVIPYLDGTVVTSRFSVSKHRLSKFRIATCNTGGWSEWVNDEFPYSNGRRIETMRTIGTLSSMPIPLPEFKPLEKAMSPKHIWNAIALVRSLLPT